MHALVTVTLWKCIASAVTTPENERDLCRADYCKQRVERKAMTTQTNKACGTRQYLTLMLEQENQTHAEIPTGTLGILDIFAKHLF